MPDNFTCQQGNSATSWINDRHEIPPTEYCVSLYTGSRNNKMQIQNHENEHLYSLENSVNIENGLFYVHRVLIMKRI